MTIAEMLAKNARRYPHRPALIEIQPGKNFRKQITWQEFNDRVNRLANTLMSRGVKKGDRVMHLMMNSINWLEAYFAIIKTGAWSVPLNFRFISRQIKYCVDIAGAEVMIMDAAFTERIEAIRAELPVKHYIFAGPNVPAGMEAFEDLLKDSSVQPPDVKLSGDDECALYFTSGTTGEPKATVLCHKAMENTAIHENYAHRETIDDNFLLLQPLFHTGGKMHWFGSLIVGARATILSGNERVTPRLIFDTIHKERITIIMLLVPWLQDMVTALDNGELNVQDYDLSSWRLMHSGAQPVPPVLIHHWKGYFLNADYETHYGLTESAGPCIHLGTKNMHKLGAIGKPNLNWDYRIVDSNDNDVPQGIIGELLLKGNGVMKEYYKNPKATAQALKGGWLHTGDMVKLDKDDFIYFADRKKDVVITGGENIYPVDLETVLMAHPKAKDAAIFGIPDARLGEVVAAVVEPKVGMEITEKEMREYFEPLLPKYAWPRIVIFDKVPRNPTGKIEKTKIRDKYANLKWQPKG
ncbi:MAG: AMP-dependent synthetase [Chloroflexi bacterium RBG_16_50_9]|nr:MAG: AMP-dependent synthetase [Chloroflexi bacterium RBG_16_50_9]